MSRRSDIGRRDSSGRTRQTRSYWLAEFEPIQDGSVTITLSPEQPAASAKNWVRTVPGEGWFTIFRLYGPLEGYFDHSWKTSDLTPT